MRRQFGAVYDNYVARVRRWIWRQLLWCRTPSRRQRRFLFIFRRFCCLFQPQIRAGNHVL